MKALKVFITVFAVFGLLTSVGAPAMAESVPMQPRKLMVTAYYSPLPDQDYYIRGSYEADIRLNGRGTNGADGTPVYVGMLAAPRTYPFGTRVNIPGLGVGEVHDRGGAIYAHKDYDRIDVWMGYGEEGLARALNWGARIVQGEVYFTPHQIEPGLSYGWVSSDLPQSFVQRLKNNATRSSAPTPAPATIQSEPAPAPEPEPEPQNKELQRLEQNRTLLAAGIGKDASGADVESLQRMLWDLGYYQGAITGHYDDMTVDAVFRFQVEHGVLQSEWDKGAGYFGKRTLEALMGAAQDKIEILAGVPKEVQVWVPAKKVLPEIANLEANFDPEERQELNFAEALLNKKSVQNVGLGTELDLEDQGDEVVKLQNFLIAGGYLEDGLNTGYFGTQTEEAVLQFQLDNSVVQSADSAGAGRVGPQTLAAINSF